MTILIKGMEMPTNCDDCFLGDFYCEKCQHIDGYKMAGNRPFACPLIKIPPHGRLIDADEVAAQLQEMSEAVEDVYPLDEKERQLGIEKGLRDARRFIVELAPTVIEAEE